MSISQDLLPNIGAASFACYTGTAFSKCFSKLYFVNKTSLTLKGVKNRGSSHPGQKFTKLARYFRHLSKFTRFYTQNTVLKNIWKNLLLRNMQNSQLARGSINVATPVLEIRPVEQSRRKLFDMVSCGVSTCFHAGCGILIL